MGGSAFAHCSPPLRIERLPPTLYISLRDRYVQLLARFYAKAVTPMEAPEKDSHGDIDILVSSPRFEFTKDTLAESLQAKQYIKGGLLTSFAIPLLDLGFDDACFQLDVNVCNKDNLDWQWFTHSHGDLWNILGSTIRKFGLTANDEGLHLRVAEIEESNRKASFLFLTSDPGTTLKFLGLDEGAFWKGFKTVEQLFRYAAGSRFLRPESYKKEDLKHNDRQRMRQRPIYRRFVEEWLPAQTELVGRDTSLTRETVCKEVIEQFGVKEEYTKRLEEWRRKSNVDDLWRRIATSIPLNGEKSNLTIRALKRWVIIEKGGEWSIRDKEVSTNPYTDGDGATEASQSVLRNYESLDADRFVEWVMENWKVVRDREKGRVAEAKAERRASATEAQAAACS
ncbi:MAG: hypothetical protein M1827_000384 [Pycnora praestabilis]|nr:MAG: hypothetical protein M1827_000384 [Pycnora praestabilis]